MRRLLFYMFDYRETGITVSRQPFYFYLATSFTVSSWPSAEVILTM